MPERLITLPIPLAELKQAARLLFGARVGRLTEAEVLQEVQERQGRSEYCQRLGKTFSKRANQLNRVLAASAVLQSNSDVAKELLVLGEIAIAKQSLLSTG